jgi:hypothetical protein
MHTQYEFIAITAERPVPQWHQETMDQRWKDYQAGKTKRMTLKQLEQRLATP